MNNAKMRRSLNKRIEDSTLPYKIGQAIEQLRDMRAKRRRLSEAILQREQHLTRLEASAALAVTPPVRSQLAS